MMEVGQKSEARAQLNLETEIDAGNEADPKICIRMQIPKFDVK
jgi:hypothetical protein